MVDLFVSETHGKRNSLLYFTVFADIRLRTAIDQRRARLRVVASKV